MILITNADYYLGYSITSHLARYPSIRPQLRVLCQNDKLCMNFKSQGIDVHETDYEDQNDLSLAMRNVDMMVLVIASQANRVNQAKTLCQVALRSDVNSIILLSHVGALQPSLNSSFVDYSLVEYEIFNMDCAWTILRTDFLQQYFHLWTTFAEKHRQFPLPLDACSEFCPIDIQDVCESVAALLLSKGDFVTDSTIARNTQVKKQLDSEHAGQVYTLTGPRTVNGIQIMESLVDATHYYSYRFLSIRPVDLQQYLGLLQKDIFFDNRLKKDRSRILSDDFSGHGYRFNIIKAPSCSDLQIQDVLDYFDWISNTASSISVSHVHLLTGNLPRSMDAFFLENANSFKPRE